MFININGAVGKYRLGVKLYIENKMFDREFIPWGIKWWLGEWGQAELKLRLF